MRHNVISGYRFSFFVLFTRQSTQNCIELISEQIKKREKQAKRNQDFKNESNSLLYYVKWMYKIKFICSATI